MKIYLAHPITGLSADEVYAYYEGLRDRLDNWYGVLMPMTAKGYLRTEKEYKSHGYQQPASTNHAIVERDSWMIDQADVVLVDLTGAKAVSIGCMMELAWAHLLRKHTVVVMEPDNVHVHAFVLECTDVLFATLNGALDYLYKLHDGAW